MADKKKMPRTHNDLQSARDTQRKEIIPNDEYARYSLYAGLMMAVCFGVCLIMAVM